MALTPEGTPYVESTDLVANYPAASLSLANRVDLVGVLPFADSAARATAIPSPTDGQYTYLQDTNSTEFWNGSAWVAAGVTPGLTKLASASPSAAASVIFNDVFSATYNQYVISWTLTGSATIDLQARMRVGGSDESGSNYRSQSMQGNSSTAGATRYALQTALYFGQLRTNRNGMLVTLTSPFQTLVTTATGNQTDFAGGTVTDPTALLVASVLNNTTSYTGITLLTSSGTMTGSISIFGVQL